MSYDVAEGCPSREWFEQELAAQELPADVRGRLTLRVAQAPATSQPSAPEKAEPDKAALDQAAVEEPRPSRKKNRAPPEPPPEPPPAQLRAEIEYLTRASLLRRESAVRRDSAVHEPNAASDTDERDGDTAPEWQRAITGVSCEELLSVLAVSFAVYVDSRDEPEPAPVVQDDPLPPLVEPNWFDPPKLDYVASATWRLGLIAGLGIHTGLAPSATGDWSVGIHLRGVRPGWGSGPFQLGFGSEIGPNRNELGGGETWAQEYWTVHLLASPWTAAPSSGMRFGPALGVHGGRYGASLPRVNVPNDDGEVWFAFYELLLMGELQRGPLLARLQAGLQFPVSPYRVQFETFELFRQGPGLVMGLGIGWAGVLL